jgi:hypothetical protein
MANQTIRWIVWSDEHRELGRAALTKIGAGISLLTILAVGGCAAPISQREAVGLANTSLLKFCNQRGGCPQLRVAHAQKIRGRWLIEYDAAVNRYGVAVDDDGNTDVSVWEKSAGAAR